MATSRVFHLWTLRNSPMNCKNTNFSRFKEIRITKVGDWFRLALTMSGLDLCLMWKYPYRSIHFMALSRFHQVSCFFA